MVWLKFKTRSRTLWTSWCVLHKYAVMYKYLKVVQKYAAGDQTASSSSPTNKRHFSTTNESF